MKTKRTVADAAEEILSKVGHPLNYKELTLLLLEQCNLKGRTPAASVRSSLAENSIFKRVAEGVFALSIWDEYPTIRFAKDIGYDILKKIGRPIDIYSLGEQILIERKFKGGPKSVVRGFLNSDKRFYYDKSTKRVGLVEWKD